MFSLHISWNEISHILALFDFQMSGLQLTPKPMLNLNGQKRSMFS